MGAEGKLLYTMADVSRMLSISEKDVRKEVKTGRLACVQLGGKTLVAASALEEFLQNLKRRKEKRAMPTKPDWKSLNFDPDDDDDFTHVWPHDNEEISTDYVTHFKDVKSGTARFRGVFYKIKIGFAEWESAGANRRRAVVFVDDRPMVVFTGADDFRHSRLMASVIKIDMHQVRDRSGLPHDYDDLRVEPFRGYVTGPRASRGLAVVCPEDDYRTMVAHALLRLEDDLVGQS